MRHRIGVSFMRFATTVVVGLLIVASRSAPMTALPTRTETAAVHSR